MRVSNFTQAGVTSPLFASSTTATRTAIYDRLDNTTSVLTDKNAVLVGKKYSACGIFGKNAINDYVDLSLKQVLRQQCEKPFFKNMTRALSLISP